jgi:hypothetical protein
LHGKKNNIFGFIKIKIFLKNKSRKMVKEDFKYFKEIRLLNFSIECPDIIEKEFEIEAYRYTYKKEVEEIDFIPQALKPRHPERRFVAPGEKLCNSYGISMFIDQDKAIQFYNSLHKRTKDLLGYKYIAKGTISNNDGYPTEIEKTGHFNLHELKKSILNLKFINSNKL